MRAIDLTFRGGRVFTPQGAIPATVSVRDGVIVAVEPPQRNVEATRSIELGDDEVLMPGVVDTHVHVNEPGRTEWEGFTTATRAAAAGGVTTLVDMPLNSIPATVDTTALAIKRNAARGSVHVDVAFWGGAVPHNLRELPALHRAGVMGFKCFLLDSGVEEFPPLEPDQLEPAMRMIASLDGLLVVHAEDSATVAAAPPASGAGYRRFLESRPDAAEERAVRVLVDAIEKTACRVHVVHVASSSALPIIADARRRGLPITAETCPHYLTFVAEDIADGATQFKCCPPIREASQRELLWHALRDGIIDIVVSDHSPATSALKALDSGDFAAAWGGIASLQLSLPAVWTGARARGVGLDQVIEWMCRRPAALMDLPSKGSIEVGRSADFCVFAPEQSFVVDAGSLQHKNPITPYDGRALHGVVRSTWLRGHQVDITGMPRGRLLTRGQR